MRALFDTPVLIPFEILVVQPEIPVAPVEIPANQLSKWAGHLGS